MVSFTGEVSHPQSLFNLQNLGPVSLKTTLNLTSENCNEIPPSTHSPRILRHATGGVTLPPDTRQVRRNVDRTNVCMLHLITRCVVTFVKWAGLRLSPSRRCLFPANCFGVLLWLYAPPCKSGPFHKRHDTTSREIMKVPCLPLRLRAYKVQR